MEWCLVGSGDTTTTTNNNTNSLKSVGHAMKKGGKEEGKERGTKRGRPDEDEQEMPRCGKGHVLKSATTTKEMGCDGCSQVCLLNISVYIQSMFSVKISLN